MKISLDAKHVGLPKEQKLITALTVIYAYMD